MKRIYTIAMSIIVCGLFGAAYGAILGAAYGTLVVPLAGTVVGLVLGCFFGVFAGIVGGILGGPWGWAIGGLTPSLISAWESPALDFNMLATWLWFIVPGLIGIGVGGAVGRDLQREVLGLPGVGWLRETTRPCAIGEWLWWRRGIAEPTASWFEPAGTRVRWILMLCLAVLLLATKSCHDALRNI
jgi:hypothetical protein